MSLTQRLGQIEKKVTELTGKQGERGQVIIIRTFAHASDAVLVGYRHGGSIWPLDRTQWPPIPYGTRRIFREVWSDHETYQAKWCKPEMPSPITTAL